ncbi:hypothetical protein M9H77_00118 [Catharanthus roseus]|nr:hypothetical protein M9H77_00118 [Catharanthus roseus]
MHSQGFSNSSASSNGSSSSCSAARIPGEINHFLARVCSFGLSQVTNNLRGLWVNSFSSKLCQPSLPVFPSLPDPNLGSTSTIGLKELPIMAPQKNFSSIIFQRRKRKQEDSSIQLIHVMICDGTIQRGNLSLACTLVEKLQALLACMDSTSAIGKVASYFMDAFNQRIFTASQGINSVTFLLENEILLMQGLQWPSLIQALALRSEGPPLLRITDIGPPSTNDRDSLGEIGFRLAEFTRSVNVNLAFHGVLIGLNSIHGSPIELVLNWIRNLNPKVITIVEQEVDHNQVEFLDRFTEALFYYSTMFDSLEASSAQPKKGLAQLYMKREICNIVPFEGPAQMERHEPL